MPGTIRSIQTEFAEIALTESPGHGFPLVMIHGNSLCKEIFHHQIDGPLGKTYRLIAIDLPGHGMSTDAVDPERTYSVGGYAEAVGAALDAIGLKEAAVYGVSLGGHVAMEMMAHRPELRAAAISAAPPVRQGMEALLAAFRPHPDLMLTGKPDFDAADVAAFSALACGRAAVPEWMRQAVERADGRARALMLASLMEGRTSDQRAIVETSAVPLAVIDGAEDPIVDLDYVATVDYAALWEGRCHRLDGVGHLACWEAPDAFNPVLLRFLRDMARRFPLARPSAAAPAPSAVRRGVSGRH